MTFGSTRNSGSPILGEELKISFGIFWPFAYMFWYFWPWKITLTSERSTLVQRAIQEACFGPQTPISISPPKSRKPFIPKSISIHGNLAWTRALYVLGGLILKYEYELEGVLSCGPKPKRWTESWIWPKLKRRVTLHWNSRESAPLRRPSAKW